LWAQIKKLKINCFKRIATEKAILREDPKVFLLDGTLTDLDFCDVDAEL